MSTGINSKAVDLDAIFDPYVQGTSPGLTGIRRAGVDINTRYAPLVYGIQAAATGILCKVGGSGSFVDLNTLFAKKGSAQYSLPIDGQFFNWNDAAAPGHGASAALDFEINTSGWTVIGSGANSGSHTFASGPTPSGAVTVQITDTWLDAPGDSDAGTVTNTCATYTAIPSSGTVGCSVREHGGTVGQTTHQLVIQMKNSAGAVISTTTCKFACDTSTG